MRFDFCLMANSRLNQNNSRWTTTRPRLRIRGGMLPSAPLRHSLSTLAEKYDALALARERMADLTFEKRRLDPSNEAEDLDEAQRHLDQAIRLRKVARGLRSWGDCD
jgi:hypothetical protein